MFKKENIQRVCSFCVSDLHLVTMLLPYLNKKTKEENIITIFEKDLIEQTKLVLSRLTLNEQSKNELLKIKWNEKEINNKQNIGKEICKTIKRKKNLNIIVKGTEEYIEKANKMLNEIFENINGNNTVKIINCYDITEIGDGIKTVLKTHDKILNTSGEKEICEVFEGYEKQKYA